MPDTITSLRKENDALKDQVNTLTNEFKKLEAFMREQGESLKRSEPDNESQVNECVRSLEFLSNKYDAINDYQSIVKKELQRLSSKVAELTIKVGNIGLEIDNLQQYSYQYNAKLVGVPQRNAKESAYETSSLCADLFYAIGADISIYDIDTAHRVPSRKQDGKPNPIICKFVRRLAKDDVMSRRRDACKVDPTTIGFPRSCSVSSIRIYDHLTPKSQQVLYEARKFKEENDYQFCWTKNGIVYLRKTADSRAERINDLDDLTKLKSKVNE